MILKKFKIVWFIVNTIITYGTAEAWYNIVRSYWPLEHPDIYFLLKSRLDCTIITIVLLVALVLLWVSFWEKL